jgi:Mrp family chromosome partitioning ATPase
LADPEHPHHRRVDGGSDGLLRAVTDASVLAPLADGVILVAGAGLVNRDMAQRAKALGVVLNGVEAEGSGYYYYYYYYGEKKRS